MLIFFLFKVIVGVYVYDVMISKVWILLSLFVKCILFYFIINVVFYLFFLFYFEYNFVFIIIVYCIFFWVGRILNCVIYLDDFWFFFDVKDIEKMWL